LKAEPLRLQPGLVRFGTDLGNGEADQRFFPRDESTPRYLAEKRRVLARHPGRDAYCIADELDEACVARAQAWMVATLLGEGQGDASAFSRSELGLGLVEDFAVMRVDASGADRIVWLHACFPSGWRPEHVVGRSFSQIHAPIPAIELVLRKAPSLVEAMVTRGPYVRFVWTISADAELDHHPDEGTRRSMSDQSARGFLRVERQTIVPLAEVKGCVFLIRTYLYGFDELSPEQRGILAEAVRLMPPELAAYKGLTAAAPHALRLLQR
jgi:hypothetical protein